MEVQFLLVAAIAAATGYKLAAARLPNVRLVVFEATIVCATLVLLLVFWEILEVGTVAFRTKMWAYLTHTLLCLLGFIYPLFHLDTLAPMGIKRNLYLAWICVGYALYLLGLFWLSTHVPLVVGTSPISTGEWVRQELLAANAMIGVTMMALLCGLSSVIAPYTAFIAQNTATVQQLQQVTTSVQNTESLVAEEQLRLQRLQLEFERAGRSSNTNLVSRIFGQSDDLTQRRNECLAEVEALERLVIELRADQAEMEAALRARDFGATLLGRLVYIVYAVFAVYCIYRLGNGYRRMVWWMLARPQQGENGPRDALITEIAEWLNGKYPAYTVDNWARIIGMLMSGVVICTSLNGMFGTIRKMQRRMRPNVITDPLLVSHVYGIYAIACATILRLNVPKNMSGAIITALKFPLEVSGVQLWSDMVLCGTSTAVIFGLFVLGRNRDRAFDEEDKYD